MTTREFANHATRTIVFTGDDFAYLKNVQLDYFKKQGVRISNSEAVSMLIGIHRDATAKFKALEAELKTSLI